MSLYGLCSPRKSRPILAHIPDSGITATVLRSRLDFVEVRRSLVFCGCQRFEAADAPEDPAIR